MNGSCDAAERMIALRGTAAWFAQHGPL